MADINHGAIAGRQDVMPLVDVTKLRNREDQRAVAGALHAANRDLGFVYITGHGIPDSVITAARSSALAFFRLGLHEKCKVAVSANHRGWLGLGGSKMDDDLATDVKESFIWSHEDANGSTTQDHPLRGQNRWPDSLPDMPGAALLYLHHAHAVAVDLMRGFAIGLDLDEDFFLRTCNRPLSRASFVYYPPQNDRQRPGESDDRRFGVGPHTDFGVLTVLNQDDVGGLQVKGIDGRWMDAPPVDGALVVNVGDLLARWTGGAYTSTPHRVINRSDRERLSLVLAFDPNPETVIDSRDVLGAAVTGQQPPITCGEYLVERFAKAFPYRKQAEVVETNGPADSAHAAEQHKS